MTIGAVSVELSLVCRPLPFLLAASLDQPGIHSGLRKWAEILPASRCTRGSYQIGNLAFKAGQQTARLLYSQAKDLNNVE